LSAKKAENEAAKLKAEAAAQSQAAANANKQDQLKAEMAAAESLAKA
jgi:hypothetical protein